MTRSDEWNNDMDVSAVLLQIRASEFCMAAFKRILAKRDAAAMDAARMSDALRELLDDTQHKEHPDCDDGGYCPVRDARKALRAWEAAQGADHG